MDVGRELGRNRWADLLSVCWYDLDVFLIPNHLTRMRLIWTVTVYCYRPRLHRHLCYVGAECLGSAGGEGLSSTKVMEHKNSIFIAQRDQHSENAVVPSTYAHHHI